MTNLHGGRLRVEDGAIYKGCGITAHAGSDAIMRVQNAELDHSGYRLTFNAGTTLELAGRKRGFLVSGGEVNLERMAKVLVDEFRSGKLGKFTLEMPEEQV